MSLAQFVQFVKYWEFLEAGIAINVIGVLIDSIIIVRGSIIVLVQAITKSFQHSLLSRRAILGFILALSSTMSYFPLASIHQALADQTPQRDMD